jgi:hypothetical protein
VGQSNRVPLIEIIDLKCSQRKITLSGLAGACGHIMNGPSQG